jgi:hypothetical protein
MQVNDIRNPAERNKLILAGALGLIAILFLWWALFGFGSSSKVTPQPARPGTTAPGTRAVTTKPVPQSIGEFKGTDLDQLKPINAGYATIQAPEARRNIFVYYEPPKPPVVVPTTPTPTPTPTPPVLLASVSPANVYARTGDFTLELAGNKFTSQLRVVMDNTELPTRYIGPQQVAASVPASLIANPGSRQVMLRSSDGKLYSNMSSITVATPPVPNYTYIGIIGTPKHIDTAILQDKNSKEVLNVQRGDLLAGRFRVTSISEKEVVFVDSTLKIKHNLGMSSQGDRANPGQRPTPRVDSEDDEP